MVLCRSVTFYLIYLFLTCQLFAAVAAIEVTVCLVKMPKCGINNCDALDSNHLWSCHGPCKRTFHAGCVGVQRNCEETIRLFMLPLCADCQGSIIEKADLLSCFEQQKVICEQLKLQNTAHDKINRQLTHLTAVQTMVEGMDSITNMLSELTTQIESLSKICKTNNAAFNAFNDQNLSDHTECRTLFSDISTALGNMHRNHENQFSAALQPVLNELQPRSDVPPNSDTGVSNHVIEEIKILTTSIENMSTVLLTNSIIDGPSIAEEMVTVVDTTIAEINSAGWRFLGNKKVWKPDWSYYDAKQVARRLQQKQINKANRKRRQRKKIHNNNCNNNNLNNRYNYNHSSYNNNNNRNNYNHSSYNSNNNNNNNNNNINTNHSNKNNGYNNNNYHGNNRNNNYNNNHGNNSNNNRNNHRLLDRELLAAAKLQFANPPSERRTMNKFIAFEKGETINPYRSEDTCDFQTWPLPPRPQDLDLIQNMQIRPEGLLHAPPNGHCCCRATNFQPSRRSPAQV